MKRLGLSLFVVLTLASTLAWAVGRRGRDRYGSAAQAEPTALTDGVELTDVTGCRMSIRVDGGNIAPGCKLIPWYWDAKLGWTESDSTLWCTTTAKSDGGLRDSFLCPDGPMPIARFGYVAVQKVGCVGSDGGTGAASLVDGGPSVQPTTRIECGGPIPSNGL